LRNKLFAYNTRLNKLGSKVAWLTNAVYSSSLFSGALKKGAGVATARSFPKVSSFNFDNYIQKLKSQHNTTKKKVILYVDEFTRYLDVDVGKDAMELLVRLGYDVHLFKAESGRTYISKGFLNQAKKLAAENIEQLKVFAENKWPVIGIEPSAILSFRDEYHRFGFDKDLTESIGKNSFLLEEFLSAEIAAGHIGAGQFTKEHKTIKIHGHCHQKALSNQKVTFDALNLPENYKVSIISSGCCGMAGSFGYEKEHYQTSMQIGELKLFPSIRKANGDTIISANGTSCRHQIFDGTQKTALHPASILLQALLV
ncbi:MAG: heterodisulfide reductase-related iron-sulfur binding cluster, partial [Bacteroidota bacterium]